MIGVETREERQAARRKRMAARERTFAAFRRERQRAIAMGCTAALGAIGLGLALLWIVVRVLRVAWGSP